MATLPRKALPGRGKSETAAGRDEQIGRLLHQGIEFQKKGQLALARECYQAVLTRQPNQPDALHLMGLIALDVLSIGPAVDYLKRAVTARPNDSALRSSYAEALLRDSDPVAADRQLRRALKLSPDHPEMLSRLASCRAMLGREGEARKMFESLLGRHPDLPSALIGYASLLVRLGELDKAEFVYRRMLELHPNAPQALAGLVECRKFDTEPPELKEIETELRRPRLRVSDAVRLSRAAAKICDDLGRHDDAFGYYDSARRALRADAKPFDYAVLYGQIRSIFTAEFFASRAGYGDASRKPVFIVGMPRSGTTLTEQIVASHPRAAGAGEVGALAKAASHLGLRAQDRTEFARRVKALKPKEAAVIAREGLATLERFSTTARRITDKLPHNFEVLGLLPLLFPHAKIIHCRRNPLDTCVSCYLAPLNEKHDYAGDLSALGSHYRAYSSLMDYWRLVLPMPILEVDYEEMVADTEVQARRLIDFVGLEWDPACLDFRSAERAVHTISQVQVRQPIYRTSIGRWRRYEKHLGPLKDALGDLAR